MVQYTVFILRGHRLGYNFKTYCIKFFDHFVMANSADLDYEMLHNISSGSSSVCYYICLVVTPNLKGVKKIISSSISRVQTPVSSGQCVFIMMCIIAMITMVCLKRIIPAY